MLDISTLRASLCPTHTHAQFYGPIHSISTTAIVNPTQDVGKVVRKVVQPEPLLGRDPVDVDFWDRQLAVMFPGKEPLRIQAFVAQGGDGTVFTLENTRDEKITAALKVIHDGGTAFYPNRGVHLVLGIDHPGICSPIHCIYRISPDTLSLTPKPESLLIAMVLPYFKGYSLELKNREIAQELGRLFRFGLQLAKALYELSRRGIEHNDLHDDNIQVNQECEPIIIDFDRSQKTLTVSTKDYGNLRRYLIALVKASDDIKPIAKQFVLDYLTVRCSTIGENYLPSPKLSKLPGRMIALMQGCTDHLSEMKRQSETPFVPENLKNRIKQHLRNKRSEQL